MRSLAPESDRAPFSKVVTQRQLHADADHRVPGVETLERHDGVDINPSSGLPHHSSDPGVALILPSTHAMNDGSDGSAPPRKRCFVTIGATAPFDRLLRAVLTPDFLRTLRAHGYTELRVQYGKEGRAIFDAFTQRREDDGDEGEDGSLAHAPLVPHVSGFAFKEDGLGEEMRAVARGGGHEGTGGPPVTTTEGVVVSHAGSGSVLDAMRYGVPCVVVPNPDLLHNHQLELARELARLQYVVHGRLEYVVDSQSLSLLALHLTFFNKRKSLGNPKSTGKSGAYCLMVHSNLESAIPQIEELRTQRRRWPPARSGEEKYHKGLEGVMDEEMGWVD